MAKKKKQNKNAPDSAEKRIEDFRKKIGAGESVPVHSFNDQSIATFYDDDPEEASIYYILGPSRDGNGELVALVMQVDQVETRTKESKAMLVDTLLAIADDALDRAVQRGPVTALLNASAEHLSIARKALEQHRVALGQTQSQDESEEE